MKSSYTLLNPTVSRAILTIPFGIFAFGIVALPFFSFIFCVIWSILYFYERSTATHCDVDNYLPSISAAIGNYEPQRYVWQMAILMQALPRLLIAHQYVCHYRGIIRRNQRALVYIACMLNIVENCALVGLSLWTSSDDYELHKTCFIIFIFTSETYMLISYILNRDFRRASDTLTVIERKSLRFKKMLFFINIISFSAAGYFFLRHNSYCEPGVYTLFALMEYIVVLTNMGYHMTAYWDFSDKHIAFDCANGFHMMSSNPYDYNKLNY